MEKNFVKVHSTTDIIIIASLVILGIVLAVLPLGGAINVTGYILILAGILLIPVLKKGYKDAWEGKRYIKREYYFANNKKATLTAAVNNAPQDINVDEQDKGNTLRLEIFYSRESGRAFMQLQEYVPYKYESCTEIVEYEVSQIENLIK